MERTHSYSTSIAADDQWFNKVTQSAIKGESFNLLDVLHVDLFEDSASLFETVPIQKLKRTVKKKKEKKKKLKEPLNNETGVGKEDKRLSTIMGVKIKPHLLLAVVKKFGGVDTVRAEKLWSNKVRTTLNLSKTTSIGYSINQCYKKYLEHGYFEEEGGEEEEDQEEEEENPEEEDDSPSSSSSSSSSSSPSSPSSSSHAFSSSIMFARERFFWMTAILSLSIFMHWLIRPFRDVSCNIMVVLFGIW